MPRSFANNTRGLGCVWLEMMKATQIYVEFRQQCHFFQGSRLGTTAPAVVPFRVIMDGCSLQAHSYEPVGITAVNSGVQITALTPDWSVQCCGCCCSFD